jgi:trans-AT polyketide synthase/acyltransferase/oxidoreductase domain-containing protein
MQGRRRSSPNSCRQFSFAAPEIPVIANTTARPYESARIAETLAAQIATPVQWVDSIRYLMGCGEMAFQEIGASVLSKMVEIKATQERRSSMRSRR